MATKRTHRGFTIVECLIGLAISAVLLTAVGAALNASLVSYRENEDMFWSMNNARQALVRMTSQLRTAGYEVSPGLFVAVDLAAPLNQCSFYTATGEDITYDWRSAEKELVMRMNATGQEYKLCDNVTAARFTKIPTDDGTDCKGVQISLTVQSGRFQRTLAAAAVVRRNL